MKKNIYVLVLIILIIVLSIVTKSSIIQMIASVAGVIYVYLNTKENKYGQLFGITNTAIYGYLMFMDGLYGTTIYDYLYCIPIQIFTFFTWGKDKTGKNKKEISRFTNEERLLIVVTLVLLVTMYILIAPKFNVNYALVDGISIIVGAFGMYFVSQKKIENWHLFIITNIVTIAYWGLKCMESISHIPMLAMWAIYLINNSFGLYEWHKKLKDKKV